MGLLFKTLTVNQIKVANQRITSIDTTRTYAGKYFMNVHANGTSATARAAQMTDEENRTRKAPRKQ